MTERGNANLFEVLIGQIRQDDKLMSFSAKRCAYCPRPSFSSQLATCCIAAAPRVSAAWYALEPARPSSGRA